MIAAKTVQPFTALCNVQSFMFDCSGIIRASMITPQPPHPYDSRARLIELRSTVLGVPKRFYIYTPPGYHNERLPALYFFRGHEREWINPLEDPTRAGRTIIDVYEELLEVGMVGPMALVFPGISSDDNSVPGLLVNFRQPELTMKSGIGTGQFENYFLQELTPFVERHYHVDSERRSVEGFSLGGFQAVKIAAQHPHLFRSVGAFDGTYFWDDRRKADQIARSDALFPKPFFDGAFGVPRDRRYGAQNNPINLVRNGDGQALQRLTWIIEHGPRSAEPNQSNYYRGERLLRVLRDHHVENKGRGAMREAIHTWHWNHEHMRHAFPLHWQALRR
jgi:S-formylglutathione hydrolase FrmB